MRFPPRRPPPLASARHTAVVIGILVLVFAFGLWLTTRPGLAAGTHLGAYAFAFALDWMLFAYVAAGLRRAGTRVADVVGGRFSAREIAIDVAVAVPFWIVWRLAAGVLHRLAAPPEGNLAEALLPRTVFEAAAWIAVSLTAGFCEEFVFRGYLQKQLHAATGSAAAAVVLQGVLFGIGHSYQGLRQVVVIAALGILFGILALLRGNLRPGMLSHAWTDVVGGLRIPVLRGLS